MAEIAQFLLDTALTVGEAVVKVAAPEITKAIEASNDLISTSTLDLAKALDLSGAFIPSNPLAFAPALALAKSLTSVIAGDEQKEVIGTIDRLEKQVAPFTQRSEDVLQQLDVVIKTGEQLEQESHDRIRQAAIAAYSALDEATADLLRVQRGTARLSRVDPAIITKLNLATARFVELHSVGDTNAWKLGKDSAALMSFGDSTKTFRLTLQSEHAKLTQQLTDHSAARDRHKSHLSTLKSEESTIRSRRTRAVDDSENGWNQVAFFFKPSARDNLQTIISDADAGLERNRAAQRAADNKIRVLYLLDTLIGWATRALDVVSAAVARVAQDFQAKFARVVGAQQVSDRLFAGLLGMANVVRDGEFGSSRDNSLRVVLEVLRRFHGLRADHAALEIPGIGERRIQRAICEGLGEEGVRRLMEPPEAVEEGEEGVNSL